MRMSADPPIEIDARGRPPLGMSPAQFLARYWQRRPLLIRNAFPAFVSPISPDELAGLACEPAALARIVRRERLAAGDDQDRDGRAGLVGGRFDRFGHRPRRLGAG